MNEQDANCDLFDYLMWLYLDLIVTFYEWHYLDLIVTFYEWHFRSNVTFLMTLSRFNCDLLWPFMNDTI